MEIKLTNTQKEIIEKSYKFREELNKLYTQNEDKLQAIITVIASSNDIEDLESKTIRYENGILNIEYIENIADTI